MAGGGDGDGLGVGIHLVVVPGVRPGGGVDDLAVLLTGGGLGGLAGDGVAGAHPLVVSADGAVEDEVAGGVVVRPGGGLQLVAVAGGGDGRSLGFAATGAGKGHDTVLVAGGGGGHGSLIPGVLHQVGNRLLQPAGQSVNVILVELLCGQLLRRHGEDVVGRLQIHGDVRPGVGAVVVLVQGLGLGDGDPEPAHVQLRLTAVGEHQPGDSVQNGGGHLVNLVLALGQCAVFHIAPCVVHGGVQIDPTVGGVVALVEGLRLLIGGNQGGVVQIGGALGRQVLHVHQQGAGIGIYLVLGGVLICIELLGILQHALEGGPPAVLLIVVLAQSLRLGDGGRQSGLVHR